jgi:hypothetical protein
MLVDITRGKGKLKVIGASDVQQDIQPGATYLALSTQGVVDFELDNEERQDGSEERVRKWMKDMLSKNSDFITPGSSDDGTFIGAT